MLYLDSGCVQTESMGPLKADLSVIYVTALHLKLSKFEGSSDAAHKCVLLFPRFEGQVQLYPIMLCGPTGDIFLLIMVDEAKEISTVLNKTLAV